MNKLTGSIPEFTADFGILEELDFSQNQLTGTLPQKLEQLTSLERLYLQTNQLSGSISDTFANTAAQLKEIHWNDNQLTGTLPASLGGLVKLEVLLIDGTSVKMTSNRGNTCYYDKLISPLFLCRSSRKPSNRRGSTRTMLYGSEPGHVRRGRRLHSREDPRRGCGWWIQ
jgi:Leucine-rich repeat (LRR) protein